VKTLSLCSLLLFSAEISLLFLSLQKNQNPLILLYFTSSKAANSLSVLNPALFSVSTWSSSKQVSPWHRGKPLSLFSDSLVRVGVFCGKMKGKGKGWDKERKRNKKTRKNHLEIERKGIIKQKETWRREWLSRSTQKRIAQTSSPSWSHKRKRKC
jgi:hypothetical protein